MMIPRNDRPAMNREPGWVPTFQVFLAVAALMLVGSVPAARDIMFELGDAAANTLLILDAKHGILLKGNYSRIGFNHPGPAYLYVMAVGEAVFHDLLRLTATPFGGQILGTAVLNAGWLALLWFLLARMSRSAGAAALGLGAFTVQAALTDPDFLFGFWMPFLYFPTFAVFTLALARVAAGRLDGLVPLALSTGFLLHGHASFIGIAGLTGAIAVAAHFLAARWLPPDAWPRLASLETLRRGRGHIAAAAVVMAVFLLPPAVQTILHFPGPLGQYAGYGAGHHANPPGASLAYVLACWSGAALVPAALLPALLLRTSGRDEPSALPSRLGFLISAGAASLAVLFYTVFGVDFLSEAYIIYFYRAVPALLAAMIAIAVHRSLGWNLARRCLAGAGIAAVAFLLITGQRQQHHTEAGIPAAFQDLVRFQPGPAVLDLDRDGDWVAVWSRTAGLLAYAKRLGPPAYCLRGHWHILFTEALRCPPATAPGTPVLTVFAGGEGQGGGTPGKAADTLTALGLRFVRSTAP